MVVAHRPAARPERLVARDRRDHCDTGRGARILSQSVEFDAALLERYDHGAPRYTSYPTAADFTPAFDADAYRRVASEQSRSAPLGIYVHVPFCQTLCFYCACNKIATKNRAKIGPYLEHFDRELAAQAELFGSGRVIEQLHFGGGTPTFFDSGELEHILNAIQRHFELPLGQGMECSIEIDPRGLGAQRIRDLADMGFNRLSIGVQDLEPAVQRAINRWQPEEETLTVLDAARENGFGSINFDLMYGLPHQSVESFERTLARVVAARPDRIALFNYAHLPALFMPQRRILEKDLPSPAEKLAIFGLALERLLAAGYQHIGMDHFALPGDSLAVAQRQGALERNFQGYSTLPESDLLALGPSAIGQAGPSFAQNAKDIDDYYARVDADGLATVRGIELSADDQLRRDVIKSLMCQSAVDLDEVGQRHGISARAYFSDEIAALGQMVDDGLLEVSGETLTVLPRGRLLIRNIAMVFDAYRKSSSAPVRFSRAV